MRLFLFCIEMKVTIRNISVEDAKQIQLLSQQLGYNLSLSETEEQIQQVLGRNDNCAFVAVTDDSVVGWIHGFIAIRIETKPFVEIGGLIVEENYRGKGIGKELIEKLKEWCREKNIYDLRLRSNVKRLAAHQFYLRLGFKEMKEQKVFQINL